MNKLILFIVCMLLIPIVSAQLEIDVIKVYVDDVRTTEADEDGGDIDVYRNDIIDLIITLENGENTTTQAKLKGVIDNIDNGNDITKEQSWYDIEADDSRSKTLSFHVPDDVVIDNYNFELKIFYKFNNGTEGEYEIDYDIKVKERGTDDELDLEESFSNLTNTCSAIVDTMGGCFDYIERFDNCSNDLGNVKEERGQFKTEFDNCNQNLAACVDSKDSCVSERDSLNNRVKVMITLEQCDDKTDEEVRKAKNESQTLIMGVIAVGIGAYFWQSRKKQKMTPHDTHYYQKRG